MTINRQVLVLNRHWVAVHVCTVRRALTLLFQEMARVVDEELQAHDFGSWRELSEFAQSGSLLIRAPAFQLLVPKVIVLTHYHRCPPRTVRFNRRNIFLRDRHTCQYCGRHGSQAELTIDHLVPRSRGGRTAWDNVVLACTACNTRKGSRLPDECGMHPVHHPRSPSWLGALQSVSVEEDNRSLWQRFIDTAYWEANLRE
jgi:5-methylcytosine-specific restriction endonuclease McrA